MGLGNHWTAAIPLLPVNSLNIQPIEVVQRAPRSAPTAFPTFNSEPLDRQLQRYRQYLSIVGRPDILIVGSSRALWGVDPIILEQGLARRGYTDLKIFNFGVNGATAQVVNLILRRLLPPEQLPRLIVWADGVRAFNSGRIDHTYNQIIRSPGYQQLLRGDRPIPSPIEPANSEQICIEIPFTYWARTLTPQPSSSSELAAALSIKRQLLCGPHLGANRAADTQTIAALRDAAGFQSIPTQFNPDTYFQQFPKVPGEYDADYRNFTLKGNQATALKELLKFTQANQIPVIFINLPLTQIYLDWTRMQYEQQFRSQMRELANAKQLIFYDFSQRWPMRYGYFVDPSHLNRYGAAAVSVQLSQDLTIPKVLFE